MDGQELTTETVTPANVSSSPSPMDARTMHLQLQSPNAQVISPSFDVGDLISYEYFDTASGKLQCGLATVLERLEENKILVEPLMHEARRSLCGVVATTEEGKSILEELRNLEKEFVRCIKDAKQSSQEIWERRYAVQKEKQEVEEAVIIAQEELGDVRTAVKKIDIHHWHELVSYRTPPEIVVRVMAAVVLVLGERRRTWAEIMPILHRPGMTELLATFDSSDLTQAQREEVLQRYINTPKFTYEGVMKGSIALTELYRWVVAHVLMINVSEHRNQMFRINERRSSDLEELEQKLQEDFKKIARLNIEMNALWNRLYEVESKTASNFCASNNTTPRENQSARQRCSHMGLFERPRFAELIKMISGSWHYKMKPERRGISIYSVLCNLGAAPDRNETIILQEQNSLHLLAAMQAKNRQYPPIIQSETEAYVEEAANTHGIQQKRKPQRKTITQIQCAQNIKALVQQIRKNAEEKLQLQQRILINTRSKNTGESQLGQKLSQENYTKEREENNTNTKTFTHIKHFYTQDSPRTPPVQRRLDFSGKEKHLLKDCPIKGFDVLATLERQLQERDDALAALNDRLEEYGREKSALESRTSESVDVVVTLERQLQERDDALAALRDRLEEYGREKSALESRSSESVDALAAMERQLQERGNAFNIFDGPVNEICMEKPSLGVRLKTGTDMFVVFLRRLRGLGEGEYGVSFQDGLCTFHHAKDSYFVAFLWGVFKSLRSLRNFVFGWNWNGNCRNDDWWDALGHVQLEFGCVEAELHEFSELLRKLEEDCKDTEPTRRLQELIDIHAGYGENEDAALNLEEDFEVLIRELRHRVCEMKTMLVGQSVRERLIQARIDALSSGIHRVANLSFVVNGEVDKDKRRRALEELHEKHDSLSEELSSVGRGLLVLYALQQGREETFLRPLHEYSPFLAAKCLRNAGFLTDTIETGVFSLTSGVLMVAVIVTLMYKRYSLI